MPSERVQATYKHLFLGTLRAYWVGEASLSEVRHDFAQLRDGEKKEIRGLVGALSFQIRASTLPGSDGSDVG